MSAPRCMLALLAGLVFAAAAPAATVRGIVIRVDPDNKQLVLEGRGLGLHGVVLAFTLSADARVMCGDQPGALSDVEVGRRVRVEFETDGNHQVATLIEVSGPRLGTSVVVTIPPTPGAPPAMPPSGDGVSGVLRRVGYSDREVVVVGPGAKGPETETTVAVPETARIVKDGKDATLDDLKEGDAATVQVEKKDGRLSALSIQVGPGAATVSKPASKVVPRLRLLLKAADEVLQDLENRNRVP